MDTKVIDLFYNEYKNSISTISKLEDKLLRESYSYDKWYKLLRDKSKTIHELYVRNEELYSITVKELQNNPSILNDEIADKFLLHVDFFLNEGYKDYGAVVPVLDIIIPYFENKGDSNKIFDSYVFMAMDIAEQNDSTEAEKYFNKAIELYRPYVYESEPYRMYRYVCALFLRLLCQLIKRESGADELILDYYNDAMKYWSDDVITKILFIDQASGGRSIIRTVVAYIVDRKLAKGERVIKELVDIAEEEYEDQLALCGNEMKINDGVYIFHFRNRMINGLISEGEFVEKLLAKYSFSINYFENGFTYEYWSFVSLFDDELPADEFDIRKIFYINPSFTFVNFLLPEILKYTEIDGVRKEILQWVYKYYEGMPYVHSDRFIDICIERNLKVIFEYIYDFNDLQSLIINVFVHRQIATVIHSFMVSRLAETIIPYVYDKKPYLFSGAYGDGNRAEIISFARDSAKYHDIGKIICSGIINLQARRILDEEFAYIKKHPRRGAEILEKNEYMSRFKDVTLGHHKTFDGRRGYPENYDNMESKEKIYIDLISICDSIDAATDELGRNYTNSKDFHRVLQELIDGSGSRYSDEIVEVIANNEELIEKICKLTKEERIETQYEIYKRYVAPAVTFERKNERFARACRENDVTVLSELTGMEENEIKDMLVNSDGSSYLICDGYDKVYGVIFGKGISSKEMCIESIFVPRKHRKKGYGSVLLEHLQNMAYLEGYRKLYIKEVVNGHNDKFAWRNGFVRSKKIGFLEKEI